MTSPLADSGEESAINNSLESEKPDQGRGDQLNIGGGDSQTGRSLSFSRVPLSATASVELRSVVPRTCAVDHSIPRGTAATNYSSIDDSTVVNNTQQHFQRFNSLRLADSPTVQTLASRPISFGTASMPPVEHDLSVADMTSGSAFAPIHRALHHPPSAAAGACSSSTSTSAAGSTAMSVCPQHNTRTHASKITGPANQYVKLNVGGSLHYTTIATLTRYDSMLRAMFSGRMDVLTDDDGWVLVDRSGKHFAAILNFLRDGDNVLPNCRREMMELLAEAKYYCIQELIEQCQDVLCRHDEQDNTVCRVPIIQTAKQLATILRTSRKPVVKVLLNRNNNKYSYTSQSDDNLLKNLELFDKLVVRFNERILFVKDVGAANEVCSWTFYGLHKKVAEVEFPEARIYEEAMNILLYECAGTTGAHSHAAFTQHANTGLSQCSHCAAEQISGAVCESATSSALSSPTFEQEYRAYSDKVDKARRDLRQN